MNIQQYGLRHSDLKDMVAVFNKYPPIQEAILFGSRAKGTYKKGSARVIVFVPYSFLFSISSGK